jgi:hypothetical protein
MLARFASAAAADAARFVGETRCGKQPCHGASIPSSRPNEGLWTPWKWAWTQWSDSNIDRHSRAFRTLTTKESKQIAGYMAIEATTSAKCLRCHAPDAPMPPAGQALADGRPSGHERSSGVTCEHCHGPAERWLEVHSTKEWKAKRAAYTARGFYDNDNLRLRAEKCAECHTEIDHEIVAGGHPPLQFEMVAYAQIMQHWDDHDEHPDVFSIDPTLWAVGQIVGLRHAVQTIASRAGSQDYQSIGKFSHFEGKECYQCHHKLIDDALRQSRGHYQMTNAIFGELLPAAKGELESHWNRVVQGVLSAAGPARESAAALAQWLEPHADTMAGKAVDRAATMKLLRRIVSSGDDLKQVKRFSYSQPTESNVLRLDNLDTPWWYTAGAPEQACLAVAALCQPSFDKSCGTIDKELDALYGAVDRLRYDPAQFAGALAALKRKLFP